MVKNKLNIKPNPESGTKAEGFIRIFMLFLFLFLAVHPESVNAAIGDEVDTISNPAGTTMDLFDYWVYDYNNQNTTDVNWDSWGNAGRGINDGHPFYFVRNHWQMPSDQWWQHWTDYNGLPVQNIVQRQLVNDYPVLTSEVDSNNESLSYLFDQNDITRYGFPVKKAYQNVNELFYVDEDGYYVYNSNWEDAKLDTSDPDNLVFHVTEQADPGNTDAKKGPQFFPFNDPASGSDPDAFFLGMHMQVKDFSIPTNGQVLNPSGVEQPMVFEFSGDDDVWVFVDGVLIGDIGGIHWEEDLSINFATGEIVINNHDCPQGPNSPQPENQDVVCTSAPNPIRTTIRDEFRKAGKENTEQWNGNTFADHSYHTLDFFYLERGASVSNLRIKYNLISTSDFTAHKSLLRPDVSQPVLGENAFHFKLTGYANDNGMPAVMPMTRPDPNVDWTRDYTDDGHEAVRTLIAGNSADGNVNFGMAELETTSPYIGKSFKYVVEELPPDGAVYNEENDTYTDSEGNVIPRNPDGTFTFGNMAYDLRKYYYIGTVSPEGWINKKYYTDDSYTTESDVTFIDFRNEYGASGSFVPSATKEVKDGDGDTTEERTFNFTVRYASAPATENPVLTGTVTLQDGQGQKAVDFGSGFYYTLKILEDLASPEKGYAERIDDPDTEADNPKWKIRYTVTEDADEYDDLLENKQSFNFSVIVEDDGSGNLICTLDRENSDTAAFVNYEPYGTVQLGAKKTMLDANGDPMTTWPSGTQSFTFRLEGVSDADKAKLGTDGYVDIQVTSGTTDLTALFEAIEFEADDLEIEDGFQFTLSELNAAGTPAGGGTVKGVTYSTETATITVTLTNNPDDKTEIIPTVTSTGMTASGSNPYVYAFTNSYAVQPTQVPFSGTKTFAGYPADASKEIIFTFTITEGETQVLSTTVSSKDLDYSGTTPSGAVSFGSIEYTEPGTHIYTVKETKEDASGVTYDETSYTVTVNVTDNGSGQLVYTVTDNNNQTLNFKNTYQPNPVEVPFAGKKTFTGYPESGDPVTFTFKLCDADSQCSEKTVTYENNGTVETDKEIPFGSISYDTAGTYTYTVTETNSGKAGINYDSRTYTVIVDVTDDGTGQLKADVSRGRDPVTLDFTNSYQPEGTSVKFTGLKKLEGKSLTAGEFRFTLTGPNDFSETVTNNAAGKIEFNEIEYDQAGVYLYEIKENTTDEPGVSIDGRIHYITVTVTDDGSGKLQTSVRADDVLINGTNNVFDFGEFVNNYKPGSTSVTLGGTKVFEGYPENAQPIVFTYTLSENDEVIQETTSDGAGEWSFRTITYDETGLHTYTVRETKGNAAGVTYATNYYSVTVNVIDDGGQLKAAVSDNAKAMEFINTYTPKPVKVQFKGTKTLVGYPEGVNPKPEFTFVTLLNKDGSEVGKVTREGTGVFTFEEITYNEPGTYEYTVIEQAGPEGNGITYDPMVYPVTVIVTDDGSGQLTAEVTDNAEHLDFTNTYEPAPAEIQFGGTKVLEGYPEGAPDITFTFTLNEGDTQVGSAEVTNDGDFSFSKLSYTETGTYTYTVKETIETKPGVTYDNKVYTVVVTVTDDGTGKLSAEMEIRDADAIVFTNTYEAEPVKVVFKGKKVFEGYPASAQNGVTFHVTVSEKGVVKQDLEVTTKDQAQIPYEEIEYTEAGEHTYTIMETVGDQNGVTYDETSYEVTVTVTDDGSGKLKAAVTGDDSQNLDFENSYKPEKTSVEFKGLKTLTGYPADAADVTFHVTVSENDTVIQNLEVKTKDQAAIPYTVIEYDKAGEYVYTIRETVENQAGISYDRNSYTVTVTVTDEGSGKLTAAVTGSDPEKLDFTNTYKPEPTSVEFKGVKTLTGYPADAAAGVAFTIRVFEDGAVLKEVSVTTKDQAAIEYGMIEYSAAGEHNYTIEESSENPVSGITYDTNHYTVHVSVTDDGSGQLSATVTGDNHEKLDFNNSYKPEKTSVQFSGVKTFEDYPDNGDDVIFHFTVSENDTAIQNLSVSTKDQEDIPYEAIEYDRVGEHTYTITETKENRAGVIYDEKHYTVHVSVTDNGTGKLKATVTGDDHENLDFTNKYEPAPVSVPFAGTKVFEGYPEDAEKIVFTFTLSEGDTLQQRKTVENQGAIPFEAIVYTETGEHTYTVKETKENKAGVTYDEKSYTVTVKVTDDGSGQLAAAVTGDNAQALNFKNIYTPEPVTVPFTGRKTFTGYPEDADDVTFTFTLNEGSRELQRKTAVNSSAIEFDSITYETAGSYTYTVREINDGKDGITYDNTVYTVTVDVTDDGTGKLKANVSENAKALNFENSYDAGDATVQFVGNKKLNGKTLTANEFSFTLSGSGVNETVRNAADGKIEFSPITYSAAGIYTYEVREDPTSEPGVSPDGTIFYLTVRVTDDGNGQLKTSIEVNSVPSNSLPGGTFTVFDFGEFVNNYKAGSTSVTLGGNKVFENYPADADPVIFTYTLSENGSVIQETTSEGAGAYSFETITYDTTGTHTYEVVEKKGNAKGVTYATNRYIVTVNVTDPGSGQLQADVSSTASAMNFTNTYKTEPVKVIFSGNKTLEGYPSGLTQPTFTFTLKENGEVKQTKSRQGSGPYSFDEITYNTPGTYNYEVTEQAGPAGTGITYDGTVYPVVVTVTDDGSGQLQASVSGFAQALNFTNTYEPAPATVQFGGTKAFEGYPSDAAKIEFTFTLNEGSTQIDSKTVENEGDFTFDAITYETPGTHTYTVKETKENKHGVKYDETEYTVTVTVTDDGSGQLKTTVTGAEGISFLNTYEAEPAKAQFSGVKSFTGYPEGADPVVFTYSLSENGEEIQTKTTNGAGSYSFDEITYDTPGTYNYKVVEVNDGKAGINYDNTEYEFTVTVTDDGSGKLTAEVGDIARNLNFRNSYEAGPVEVRFSGTKTLTGYPNDAPKITFTFTLSENGRQIQSTSVENQGSFVFEPISYSEPGTYTYTVAEKKVSKDGLTCDETEYIVTVTVSDNGSGTLQAVVSDNARKLDFVNNYTPKPTEVQFGGTKVFEGYPEDAEKVTFNFTLSEGSRQLQSKTVENDGPFSFDVIPYTEAGTHTYTVKETKESAAGVTYDETVYTVTVDVIDDGSGALRAEVSGADEIVFTNTYQAKPTAAKFSGVKSFEGYPASADPITFYYTLSENGSVLQTKSTSGAGSYSFDEISYNTTGEHTYTVKETQEVKPGVTYDSTEYTVTVDVTDDGTGQLKTAISDNAQKLNFANSYQPKPVDVQFSGTKVFEGYLEDAEKVTFTFTLSENGTELQSKTVQNQGDFSFDKITYETTGTHTYSVVEKKVDKAGVTSDETEYTVKVTVSDDGSGQLKASVSSNANALNFRNTYKAAPAEAQFGGTKVFEGYPENAPKVYFTFTLSEGGKQLQTKTVENQGAFSFDKITYEEAGVHTYTVTETRGTKAGVTYDERSFTVTVTVIDDGSGELRAEVSGADAVNFLNSYKAKPVIAKFSGVKRFEGYPAEAKPVTFTYTLSQDGEILETQTTEGSGSYSFGEISYDKAGTYTYTVKETNDGIAGVNYDKTEYTVTVTVTDDGSGQLAAELSSNAKQLNFTNTYKPEPVKEQFSGIKTFEGYPEGADPIVFSYTLSENGKTLQTKTTNGAGSYEFDEITYSEPGSHTYTVQEMVGSAAGVTYDKTSYTVTVNVTDDGTGKLKAETSRNSKNLNFTNSYQPAPTEAQFGGTKTFKGYPKNAPKVTFTFALKENGNLLQSKTVDNEGSFTFDKIKYTEAGTYTYTVTETKGSNAGVTYDETSYTVTVTVTDDGSGQLKASVSGADKVSFTNIYKAEPVKEQFSGVKTFEGYPDGAEPIVFTYTLSENNKVIQTKTTEGAGSYSFDEISYDVAGTHTYIVKETAGTSAGVTYDRTSYTVTVKVIDDGSGKLKTETSSNAKKLDFINTYEAAPVEIRFGGTKVLEGYPEDAPKVTFTFTLSEGGRQLQSKTVENQGAFTFDAIPYTETGIHTYTVGETKGNKEGITYDTAAYTVIVTVTDDGSGKLSAEVVGADGISFTNPYKAKPTSEQFSGVKSFEGYPAGADPVIFTYTLSENGRIIQTKTTEGSGSYSFDEITYDTAGTHTYTVKEVIGGKAGVTYDETEYTVTVKVIDDGSGQLKTETGSNAKKLDFTNVYKPEPVDAQFGGTKVFEGYPEGLEPPTFMFELRDANNRLVETKSVSGTADFSFSTITFDEVGTYRYTVSERAGNAAAVTYSEEVYDVTVEVTDDGSGKLAAEVEPSDDGERVFVNTYQPLPVSASFGGTKTVRNYPRNAAPVVFTYVAKDENGEIVGTATTTGSGFFVFDEIIFDEAGSYTFYVSEVNGGISGINYDDKTYEVTVDVTDDGTGQLYAVVSENSTRLNFVNSYGGRPNVTPTVTETPEGGDSTSTPYGYNEKTKEAQETATVIALSSTPTTRPWYTMTPTTPTIVKTGFSALHPQSLPAMPQDLKYEPLHWTLEIPSLSLVRDIYQVPNVNGEYPVTWLGESVGLLDGYAMPGEGRAILTGHNHVNTTEAGPFAFLQWMNEGDRVFVLDPANELHVFTVYANEKISETDFDGLDRISGEFENSLTMITCEDERPSGGYANRRIIAARPVD